jgi:hypothetical protein
VSVVLPSRNLYCTRSWRMCDPGRGCDLCLYHIILYHIILYCIISYHIILYCIVLHYIILYHIILYYIILYHIILYHIISCYLTLCYIALQCIILLLIISLFTLLEVRSWSSEFEWRFQKYQWVIFAYLSCYNNISSFTSGRDFGRNDIAVWYLQFNRIIVTV